MNESTSYERTQLPSSMSYDQPAQRWRHVSISHKSHGNRCCFAITLSWNTLIVLRRKKTGITASILDEISL